MLWNRNPLLMRDIIRLSAPVPRTGLNVQIPVRGVHRALTMVARPAPCIIHVMIMAQGASCSCFHVDFCFHMLLVIAVYVTHLIWLDLWQQSCTVPRSDAMFMFMFKFMYSHVSNIAMLQAMFTYQFTASRYDIYLLFRYHHVQPHKPAREIDTHEIYSGILVLPELSHPPVVDIFQVIRIQVRSKIRAEFLIFCSRGTFCSM